MPRDPPRRLSDRSPPPAAAAAAVADGAGGGPDALAMLPPVAIKKGSLIAPLGQISGLELGPSYSDDIIFKICWNYS